MNRTNTTGKVLNSDSFENCKKGNQVSSSIQIYSFLTLSIICPGQGVGGVTLISEHLQ